MLQGLMHIITFLNCNNQKVKSIKFQTNLKRTNIVGYMISVCNNITVPT